MTDTRPISPSYLDLQTARATVVLPGAGAYDATPIELPCQEYDFMTLYIAYTRGDTGGAFKMKIEVSPDSSGDTWYRSTVYDAGAVAGGSDTDPSLLLYRKPHGYDAGAVAGGSDTTSLFQREELQYTATGATVEKVVFRVTLDAGVQRVRIPCAEAGAV